MTFDRASPPQATTPCVSPCVAGRAEADALSARASARIESLNNRCEPTTGLLPHDDQPQSVPAGASPCEAKAAQLGPTLRRYNRYRDALPYARAASDMNGRLGATAKDKDKPVDAPCLTRLSTDAAELNRQLGLPEGTVQDADLRQEDKGYRSALYRDDSTGRLIAVSRDTQPKSLIDWETNTRNGQGLETDQYAAARDLAGTLKKNGVDFDVAGYSKGGGLAQEMALVNPDAKAYVFNASGLPDAALARTGNTDFASLASRTQAFSAKGDFLTYMNTTTDPAQQLANVEFLQRELKGENRMFPNPMKIDFASPAAPKGKDDPAFAAALARYQGAGGELDQFVAGLRKDVAAGKSIQSFPPVRAAQQEVIPGSDSFIGNRLGANDAGPNLGKLNQHLMENVTGPMEQNVKDDAKTLARFLDACP